MRPDHEPKRFPNVLPIQPGDDRYSPVQLPAAPEAPTQPALAVAEPPRMRASSNLGPTPVELPPTLQQKTEADRVELTRMQQTGSGLTQLGRHPGFFHKLGAVAGRIGDIAGTAFFPGITAQIPGTELHHQMLMNQQQGRVTEDLAEQEQQSKIAGQEQDQEIQRKNNELVDYTDPITQQTIKVRQADLGKLQQSTIAAQGRKQAAEIGHRFSSVPGVGLFDTSTRQVVPGTQNGITVTKEIADDYGLPAEFIGKPMTLQTLSGLKRAELLENVPIQSGEGPIVVNRSTGQAREVVGPNGQHYSNPGVATALIRPYEAADPDNPGETIIVPSGKAAGMAGKGSASIQTPRAMGRYMTSGAGGKQLTAFNTAITHLDTLERLAGDLGNSDLQISNRAKQAWAEQTGHPAPANFAAAVNAMSGEVAAALKASGATDQEIAHVQATFNRAQSPRQLKSTGAIGTYRELLNSKAEQLRKQYEAGMEGLPNFSTLEQNGADARRNTGASRVSGDRIGTRQPSGEVQEEYVRDKKTGKLVKK